MPIFGLPFPVSVLLFLALHLQDRNSFKPPLCKAEEEELLQKCAQGDKAAANRLVECNLRLVAHLAKKYSNNQSEQDEYISIGTIGLIKAVHSYDPSKEIKFSTYASKCITNEIFMFFRSQKRGGSEISLNEPISGDDESGAATRLERLESDYSLEDEVDLRFFVEKLRFALQCLTERDRTILSLRYGLGDSPVLTQMQIAKKLGISRSYISRLEKAAVERLKQEFDKIF